MSFEVSNGSCGEISTWKCEKNNTCVKDESGIYFAEKYCKQHCQKNVEEAKQIMSAAVEMMREINASLFFRSIEKKIKVKKNEESIACLFTIIDNKICIKFSNYVEFYIDIANAEAEIQNFFFKEPAGKVSPDVYMNVIKLLTASYAVLKQKTNVKIKLLDASFVFTFINNENQLKLWPWLVLCRGFSFYEGRGFFSNDKKAGLSHNFRKKLKNTTVKDFLSEEQISIPPEIINKTLKEIAAILLNEVYPVEIKFDSFHILQKIETKVLKLLNKNSDRTFFYDRLIDDNLLVELASDFDFFECLA